MSDDKNFRGLTLILSLFILNSCATTKYIPVSYFQHRHTAQVKVRPIPAPSHTEQKDHDEGLVASLVSTAVKSDRAASMRATFAHIDSDKIRDDLKENISKKIKEYYDVAEKSHDLMIEVEISSWGWILPTGPFGIRLGSYQLQLTGQVRVYDVTDHNKEIAYTTINTQEEMRDQMSPAETTRRVNRAIDEFSEMAAEFLWRSDDKI
jgi:hypothetical protein